MGIKTLSYRVYGAKKVIRPLIIGHKTSLGAHPSTPPRLVFCPLLYGRKLPVSRTQTEMTNHLICGTISSRCFFVLCHFACPSVHFEGMDGVARRGGRREREGRSRGPTQIRRSARSRAQTEENAKQTMDRPSVRPSVRPSACLSLCLSRLRDLGLSLFAVTSGSGVSSVSEEKANEIPIFLTTRSQACLPIEK